MLKIATAQWDVEDNTILFIVLPHNIVLLELWIKYGSIYFSLTAIRLRRLSVGLSTFTHCLSFSIWEGHLQFQWIFSICYFSLVSICYNFIKICFKLVLVFKTLLPWNTTQQWRGWIFSEKEKDHSTNAPITNDNSTLS